MTPEAIHPKRMRRFVPFLESQRPDLLVIFPEWYPEIAARTDLFHEIYRVHAHQDSRARRTWSSIERHGHAPVPYPASCRDAVRGRAGV